LWTTRKVVFGPILDARKWLYFGWSEFENTRNFCWIRCG
jgi:hypothetical protein